MNYSRKSSIKTMLGALALAALLAAGGMAHSAKAETFTCIVTDGQYVNVRKQPSSTAATWGIMHTDETIEANPKEITGGFFKTTFNGRDAYVSVRYFEIAEDADYTVTANGRVRVRKTPGGDASGFIKPGETVHVRAWRYAADGSLWARCPGPKYISADYLTPVK